MGEEGEGEEGEGKQLCVCVREIKAGCVGLTNCRGWAAEDLKVQCVV